MRQQIYDIPIHISQRLRYKHTFIWNKLWNTVSEAPADTRTHIYLYRYMHLCVYANVYIQSVLTYSTWTRIHVHAVIGVPQVLQATYSNAIKLYSWSITWLKPQPRKMKNLTNCSLFSTVNSSFLSLTSLSCLLHLILLFSPLLFPCNPSSSMLENRWV